MSAGTLIAVADAVVAALNAGISSGDLDTGGVAARRTLDTELELEDAEAKHIDVVPGSIRSEIGTRESQRGEFTIDIAVRQTVDTDDTEKVDALFVLLGKIDAYLFGLQRLPDMEEAVWLESNPRYPFIPAHLRTLRQYTGILSVTYLVFE